MCTLYAATASLGGISAASENPVSGYESAVLAFESGDYANALIYGKLAGSGGDADAQVLVGHILMNGLGVGANKDGAVNWYLKAAANGNTDAMVALGELALGAHGGLSASDAVSWLTRAANKGRSDAMRALADIYLQGKGTAPDRSKAQNWLVKASNYGDAKAERKLGDFYFETRPTEAIIWYEKAAANGDAEAAYFAAIMYAENYEIKPDAGKVAKLLQQAANAGLPAAQADFGLVVYQGNGIERSEKDAANWFKKSAENGDPEGRFLYAFTLAKGEGVPQSYEDAYYWLLRAEEAGATTSIAEYDQSRAELKKRLEANIAPAVLSKAKARASKARALSGR
ncbi:MAG: sel1 repeat family protein [Robiginitomaculum sp.]|nr:sel1 repeat family protein [Robiginitomaculum sp.]